MTPLPERRAMIDDQLALSKSAQCRILGLNRSGIYYENRGESSLNLDLSDTNYASFIRKCMWALADINTEESIELLKNYLESENPVIKQYADEQLRWLNGEKGMRYMG